MIPQDHIRNFFHHRPHRPRQVHALRPAHRESAAPWSSVKLPPRSWTIWTWSASGAITIKARAVGLQYMAADGESLHAESHRTRAATWTSITRSRAPWPPARGRFWWWTPPRAWKPRHLPMPIWTAWITIWRFLPVVNKIDLPAADPARTKAEIEDIIGIPALEAPEISSKIRRHIGAGPGGYRKMCPAPVGRPCRTAARADLRQPVRQLPGRYRARGLFDGVLLRDMEVRLMATGAVYKIVENGSPASHRL